jgi:hypothetical protein
LHFKYSSWLLILICSSSTSHGGLYERLAGTFMHHKESSVGRGLPFLFVTCLSQRY